MRVRVGLSMMAAAMLIGQAGAAQAPGAKAAVAARTKAAPAREQVGGGVAAVLAACGFGLLGVTMRQRRPGRLAI